MFVSSQLQSATRWNGDCWYRNAPKSPCRSRGYYRTQVPCRTVIHANIPSESSQQNGDKSSREELTAEGAQDGKKGVGMSASVNKAAQPTDETELFVEQWIGTSISRWEWYERFKCRQQRITAATLDKQRRFDEDMVSLKQSLMELQDVFGPGLVDDQSNISPLGWGITACIMSTAVAFGYATVHAVVDAIMHTPFGFS